MTQSTLSSIIKQLEDDLGVRLFQRNSHGVSITEAGEQLLPSAQEALYQAENCIHKMYDLSNLRCGTLDIGVTHSFSLIMVEAILKFTQQYPGIHLSIHYKTMGELLDMLLLAGASSVSLNEVARHRLALPAKGLQARNLLEEMAKLQNVSLDVALEFDLVTPLLRLVHNSNFATILSDASVDSQHSLRAVPIEGESNVLSGSFHVLKGAYRKKSATEFIRILCDTDAVKERRNGWSRI